MPNRVVRFLGLSLVLGAGMIAAACVAQPADASDNCVIEVGGRVFVDKPCTHDHDEMVIVLNTGTNETEPYVYLFRETETKANASWSGETWAAHAHDPLGDLTREGRCWVNETARICLPSTAVEALDRDWTAIVAASSPPYAYNCLIQVDDRMLIDEPCPGFVDESAVSINKTFIPRPLSASVSFEGEQLGHQAQLVTGAEDPQFEALGRVVEQGDYCWTNDRARLCLTPID
jgi:hypothetical protein